MKVKATLQDKRGIYQVVLSYADANGIRKQKWISTGLPVKGNKRIALEKLEEIKNNFILNMEETTNIERNNDMANKPFEIYMKDWLDSMKGHIEEDTYDSYSTVVYKIKEYFEPLHIRLKDSSRFIFTIIMLVYTIEVYHLILCFIIMQILEKLFKLQ